MTREKVLSLLKGKTINDILEASVLRENEPLLISGLTLDDGYVIYLKPAAGTETVELSVGRPAEDAERHSFMELLKNAKPDSFFDFRSRYMTLEEIRSLVEEHRKTIRSGGCGANETHNGSVRVRFDESLNS